MLLVFMRLKQLTVTLGILSTFFCVHQASGQNESDVLRYSRSFYPANARAAGAANAFGAVGANSLSPTQNPAGLGLYRKSEASVTPAFEVPTTSAQYLGSSSEDKSFNFNIGQVSLVLNSVQTRLGKPKQEGWAAYTFAIGMNRRRGFEQRGLASGRNTNNSILNGFTERAEGRFPSNLSTQTLEGLAYQNFLITPFAGADSTSYFPSLEPGDPDVQQTRNFSSEGAVNDLYLSFGANYSNSLYLGVTLGFPIVNYEQTVVFREQNNAFGQANLRDSLPNFRSMRLERSVSTSGNGFYGGLGAIYRPADFMRLGVSIFSPTFYSLDDNFDYTMSAEVSDIPGSYDNELSSPDGNFSYNLTTPFRLNTSLAFFAGNWGFLSVDYQYQPMNNGQLSAEKVSFGDVNSLVSDLYQPTHQLRIGSEVRIDIFSLRAGYGYFSSPFKGSFTTFRNDGEGELFSTGFGVGLGNFTVDLAYQAKTLYRFQQPYEVEGNNPQIQEEVSRSHFMLTGTYRW